MTSVQPLVVNAADVSTLLARLWWPVLRIGGFVLTAPIASETTIPGLIKLVFTVGLAFVLAPLAPVPAELSIFSGAGAVTAVQELLKVEEGFGEVGARAAFGMFDGVEEAHQLALAGGGRDVVFNLVVEDDEAGGVALLRGEVGEGGRDVAGVV